MSRLRLILITSLGALALPLFAASAAQADVYSCAFTGAAGPITPYNDAGEAAADSGVEAVANDLANDEGDGSNALDDSDNGNGRSEATGQDGTYEFDTSTSDVGAVECLYVETGGDAGRASGVYAGDISSNGEFDNVVCGTGWAVDDDLNRDGSTPEVTSVTFGNPGIADITDADYRIDFTTGQGVLDIRDATNADGESGAGAAVDGSVSIEPTSGNCVTTDVTQFQASGAFTGMTS